MWTWWQKVGEGSGDSCSVRTWTRARSPPSLRRLRWDGDAPTRPPRGQTSPGTPPLSGRCGHRRSPPRPISSSPLNPYQGRWRRRSAGRRRGLVLAETWEEAKSVSEWDQGAGGVRREVIFRMCSREFEGETKRGWNPQWRLLKCEKKWIKDSPSHLLSLSLTSSDFNSKEGENSLLSFPLHLIHLLYPPLEHALTEFTSAANFFLWHARSPPLLCYYVLLMHRI